MLMNAMVGVLSLPGRRHLLPGFTTFLPAAYRPTYLELIRCGQCKRAPPRHCKLAVMGCAKAEWDLSSQPGVRQIMATAFHQHSGASWTSSPAAPPQPSPTPAARSATASARRRQPCSLLPQRAICPRAGRRQGSQGKQSRLLCGLPTAACQVAQRRRPPSSGTANTCRSSPRLLGISTLSTSLPEVSAMAAWAQAAGNRL